MCDTKKHYNFSLEKFVFFINKYSPKHLLDYNSYKGGMSTWRYSSNIVVVLMEMLMVFCNLICLSERKTLVKCSIMITEYVSYTLLATINETA